MGNLNILGAVYGLADVTLQVRSLVQNDTLTVVANNATFGDSWPGTRKSLVLVYQQGNRPPQVGIVQENNAATIWPDSQTTTAAPAPDGQLTILGAAYGLADVTDKVRGLISGNSLQVTANNSTFQDQWPGIDKTLVVVYQFKGIPLVRIAQENSVLQILSLAILGATYGPEIITAQVSTFIDPFQEVHLPAPSTVFVDPWPGNQKSLAVIYQYGSEQPQTLSVKDTDPLTITYTPHAPFQGATDPTHLQILGAAYSLADVTAQVSNAVQNNSLVVRAENGIFNVDPWPLVVKTLTVVYQYGNGAPRVKNCVEHQQVQILAAPNYGLRLANQAFVSGSVYNFGTGSLTLEAWIQTTQPGPIITFRQRDQVGMPALENLALGVDQAGVITFSLTGVDASGNKINLQTASSTAATPLLDGQWHHVAVVRNGSTLLIYIDGDPLALTQPNPQESPADLSAAGTFYLGVGEPIPAGGPPVFAQNHYLTGAIDEVRFWNVARPQASIQDGMHHQLTDREEGLVGHWTFDLQNLADSSPTNATLSATGSVSYFASDLDIEPAGQPYLITQAQLMQDYIPDPDNAGQFREISGYRVMVTARDAFGNPSQSTVTIWAADPSAPAQLYFFDGSSAIVTDQTPVNRRTNAQGEVSFVIDAANPAGQPSANALLCPMIKLNASFMEAGHRLVISPDRHVHATLANLTGDQLLGRQALPSGKTAPLLNGQYANQANAAAQAISRVMNTAIDQHVQPERPVTRKRGAPLDEALSQPAIPEYEKVGLLTTPYDFRSNGVGTYFLAADEPQGLTRILVAENMADSYWEVDFGTASSATREGADGTAVAEASFTVLSVAERNSRIAALNVTHLDDYTQMFNNQITVSTTMAQLLAIAQAEDTPSNRQKRWFGESFLDKVTGATRIIVTTVTAAVTDAAETVKNLVVTVVDAVGQAVDAILQTVEDALNFAVALLKKFGVLIANIVDFVKSLFNWDDILQTQKVLQAALTQMRTLAQSALDAMESKVDTALTGLQNAINGQFNSWVTALSGKTVNQQTGPAKNQPPQDLQSKYVMSLYADNLSTARDDANTLALDSGFATQVNQTWAQQFPDSSVTPLQNTVVNSGIEAYLVSPESLLSSGLAQVLALLQSAVTGLVSLVQSAVHALFGFLKQQIDQVWALCTAPINIPVVTSFYQTTVVPGDQLTMLSLIALAAAIPLTVTYKLVTGQSGSMFTDDDLTAVRNANWSGYTAITSSIQQTFGSASGAAGRSVAPAAPDARGVGPTTADWVWWGLGGYAYAFSSLAWGISCYIEDSTQNVSKVVTWAKIAFQLLADITCCPAIPLRGTPTPRTAVIWINWWIWGGGIAALLCNTVTAATGQFKLRGADRMADVIDPLVTGVYGVLQLIGYTVVAGLWSGVWGGMYFAIGLGESLEWAPQLLKLLALVKPDWKVAIGLVVARIELIGYGIVFGGYATLTSALIAQVYTSSDGGSQAAFA